MERGHRREPGRRLPFPQSAMMAELADLGSQPVPPPPLSSPGSEALQLSVHAPPTSGSHRSPSQGRSPKQKGLGHGGRAQAVPGKCGELRQDRPGCGLYRPAGDSETSMAARGRLWARVSLGASHS